MTSKIWLSKTVSIDRHWTSEWRQPTTKDSSWLSQIVKKNYKQESRTRIGNGVISSVLRICPALFWRLTKWKLRPLFWEIFADWTGRHLYIFCYIQNIRIWTRKSSLNSTCQRHILFTLHGIYKNCILKWFATTSTFLEFIRKKTRMNEVKHLLDWGFAISQNLLARTHYFYE